MKDIFRCKEEKGLLFTDIVIIVAIFIAVVLIIRGIMAFTGLTKSLKEKNSDPRYNGQYNTLFIK